MRFWGWGGVFSVPKSGVCFVSGFRFSSTCRFMGDGEKKIRRKKIETNLWLLFLLVRFVFLGWSVVVLAFALLFDDDDDRCSGVVG